MLRSRVALMNANFFHFLCADSDVADAKAADADVADEVDAKEGLCFAMLCHRSP